MTNRHKIPWFQTSHHQPEVTTSPKPHLSNELLDHHHLGFWIGINTKEEALSWDKPHLYGKNKCTSENGYRMWGSNVGMWATLWDVIHNNYND